MPTKDSLLADLIRLGVREGDTLFVRAALGKVGRFKASERTAIIDAILDVLGPEGTIVTLGFTKTFPVWKIDKYYFFTDKIPSTTGALSKLFLEDSNCKRSKHPCCSFLAIGQNADFIVDGHDESSLCYSPVKKLIELNAKCMLIGCVDDSPGFTTTHYVQEELHLTSRSVFSGLTGVYYIDNHGSNKKYIRKDIGGCSRGFEKFYKFYRDAGILTEGKFGNAVSYLADAQDLYRIDYALIDKDNTFPLCENDSCIMCRCGWYYNLKEAPRYLSYRVKRLFKS